MSADPMTEVVLARRALAAAGLSGWSDAEECAAKHAECWNPRQLHAGFRYLPRTAGVCAPDDLEGTT